MELYASRKQSQNRQKEDIKICFFLTSERKLSFGTRLITLFFEQARVKNLPPPMKKTTQLKLGTKTSIVHGS